MKKFAFASVAAAALLGGFASAAAAADIARYEVRFDATWTADSHPLDYPGNAHFSGLVGATHNDAYTLFADGGTATPGLEALSEKGAHSPLDGEIRAAIDKGIAGALFESAPLFSFPGKLMAQFTASPVHPYASVAAMVAPSPDWFTGVSQVALMKDGKWIDSITLTLYAWDAGTDNGTTYKAADADAQPRQSIRLNAAPQFAGADGAMKPVGTVSFIRLKDTASN